MNILQINTADIRGGAAKVAYRLKRELEKLGHSTSMFVGQKDSQDENVFILNDKRSLAMRIRRKMAYYTANDIDIFKSDKIMRTEEFKKADVIHCHNLHSYYFNLNTLKKIAVLKPVVWTFHDMWPITAHCAHAFEGGVKNGFFQCPSKDIFPPIAWHNEKYLENRKRAIYRTSKFTIVVPSLWLKEKVEKSVLNEHPIELIYNGVDTNIFKPYPKDAARAELSLPNDKKIILSVTKGGLNNPWKGANYASDVIQKWQEKKDVVFVNLGGDLRLGVNMLNIPHITSEGVLARYYSAADALLYPSIADNCPLVVLEAQACGLPVIAFKTGGIPEIIKHLETGYIAKYKNEDDLNFGLKQFLEFNNSKTAEIHNDSVQNIKQSFTLNEMTDKYLALYRKISVL